MKKNAKWCLLGCLLVASVFLAANDVQAEGDTTLIAESSNTTTSKTYALVQYVYLNNNGESVPIGYDLVEVPETGSLTITPKQIDGFVLNENNNGPREVSQTELASGFPINFTGTLTKDLPMVQPPRFIYVAHGLYRDSSFSSDAYISSEFEQVWVYPGETSTVSAKSIPGYTYKGRLDGDGRIIDNQTTVTTAYRYSPGVQPVLNIVVFAYVKDGASVPSPTDEQLSVHRLYNPGLQVHLYTTDNNEVNVLKTRGWNYEGISWNTEKTLGDPVYRMYNEGLKVHLYTKDTNEYKVLATRGWKQEGVAYRSQGSVPVYRLYHIGLRKHLYTIDKNEYNVLAIRGWKQEGVAWYSHSYPFLGGRG